ncbi:TetR/AcrR family transcriptional regulator [Aeromicrobium ginsengisoli]|uniref:TetR/AcrR family transcriptional regulator n=1 Tax=Aeromicrobium ginsengisoli TaxID=363867 RepID=A0A5M4FBS7_9ACTN|nr:TetR/AcrR family transcriptional regulator [Aeromicrobium ginsengisoli]KAA1395707.1 TetR/AcrR family transcriptional regulator [Aeromicrobium ginsengisoli]
MTERHTDGRIARGERTRDAIVEAHAGLLREGVLKPTAKVIAERAGVSLRTLWLNFKDLETLLEATTAYWLDADAALRQPIDPDVPLSERIDAFCQQRAVRLEHLAPAARSAVLGEPFSSALAAARRELIDRLRRDLLDTFGAELAVEGGADGALCLGLMAATSGMTWSFARDDLGRDVADARAIMRDTVTRLLRA